MAGFRLPVLWFATVLGVLSCAEIPTGNPWDPETPSAQQQKGEVRGRLVLPDGFDAETLRAATVMLRNRGGGEPSRTEAPAPDGAFAFEAVAVGAYTVEVALTGFTGPLTPVVLGIGQAIDLGELPLRVDTAARGTFEGIARLQGAAPGAHAGIRVSAVDTPELTFTGDDGRFRLSVPAGAYTLAFSYRGYGATTLPTPRIGAGETSTLDTEVVLDALPGRVSVVVSLPEGYPPARAAEAAVRLLPADAPDDAEAAFVGAADAVPGTFVFPDVPPGLWRLVISLSGFAPAEVRVELAPGGVFDAGRVRLAPVAAADFGRIAGAVRWAGAPPDACAGTEVRLVDAPFMTLTGADGRYVLDAPPGLHTVRFARPGFTAPDAEVMVETGRETKLDATLLAAPGFVAGTVTLPEGYAPESLAAARVTRSAPGRDDAPEDAVTPGIADGAFLFEGVPPGRWRVDVALDDPPFEPLTLFVVVGPAERVELGTLRLRPSEAPRGTLTGRVDLEPPPLSGPGGTSIQVPGTPWRTLTDEAGDFRLDVPAAAATSLRFSRRGYTSPPDVQCGAVVAGVARVCQPEAALRGDPGTVRGFVDLPDGYGPDWFSEVEVSATAADAPDDAPPAVGPANPDAEGRFALSPLGAGEWRVRATLAGFESADARVLLDVGESRDLGSFVLTPLAADQADRLAGVSGVVELQGVPAEGGLWGGILVQLEDSPVSTLTAPDGRFQLQVPPGPNRVLVFWREFFGIATYRLPMLAAAGFHEVPEHAVQLVANPGAARGAVVLAEYGDPAMFVNVAVTRVDAGGEPAQAVVPGPDGRFVLDAVPSGEHTLHVALPGYDTRSLPFSILPGRTTELGDIVLRHASAGPSAVALRGRVALGDGADPAGTAVEVRFVDPERPFRATLVDADGTFEVPAAPADRYRVFLRRAGYDASPAGYGPVRFDAAQGFVTEAGDPLAVTLPAADLDGRVRVDLAFAPDWIPPEEQVARVRLEGPGGAQTIEGVRAGLGATLTVRRAGRYRVVASRAGFADAETEVTVTSVEPSVDAGVLALHLRALAEAALDLSAETLDASDFGVCPEACVSLVGADLTGATLTGDFGGRDLTEAVLVNADLRGATLSGARLDRANLFGADLSPPDDAGPGADLRGASLRSAVLFGARLRRARLAGATLEFANFTAADLRDADFVDPGEALPAPPCDPASARPAVRLAGAVFAQADLSGADLPGVDLTGTDLGGARLVGADFSRACLRATSLALTDLSEAHFVRADLGLARFGNAVMTRTDLRGADLSGASLVGTILEETRFDVLEPQPDGACAAPAPFEAHDEGGVCTGADADFDACFCRTRLTGGSLSGANLVGTRLTGADLSNVSLIGAAFGDAPSPPAAQPEDCALPDGCAWVTRAACGVLPRTCRVQRPDLSGTRLDGADLSTLTLNHVDLRGATLRGTRLPLVVFLFTAVVGADFSRADLRQADLTRANLTDTRFVDADLFRAGLRETRLVRTTFDGADLTEVDWALSEWQDVRFSGALLSGVTGKPTRVDGLDLTGATAPGLTLDDLAMTRAVLDAADLEGARLSGSRLVGARARGTRFVAAGLDDVDLTDADLSGAVFDDATAGSAIFVGAVLDGARLDALSPAGLDLTGFRSARATVLDGLDLSGLDMAGVDFTDASLVDAVLTDADLSGAILEGADLTRARLAQATLAGARADDARLTGATIDGVTFAGASLVAAHLDGVTAAGGVDLGDVVADGAVFDRATLAAGASLAGGRFVGASFLRDFGATDCDARTANFSDAAMSTSNLTGCDLSSTRFRGADLTSANLSGAGGFLQDAFDGATLVGVQFPGRALVGMDFRGRDLRVVGLANTDLTNARFDGARLTGGHLSPAAAAGARFDGADLSNSGLFLEPRAAGIGLANVTLRDAVVTLRGIIPGLTLRGLDLAGAELLTEMPIDLSGANLEGATIGSPDGSSCQECNFSGARLAGANLRGFFGRCDFTGADMRNVFFGPRNAQGGAGGLYSSTLRNADLANADLRFVSMSRNRQDWETADVTGANLQGAQICNLYGAWLRGYVGQPSFLQNACPPF